MTGADDDTPPAPMAPDGGPWRNFYGRRHGKPLRARQRHLLETWLPELTPPGIERAANPQRRPLEPERLFPGKSDLWLEVGFGGGEHLLAQARRHPEIGFIGCEPFVNGMAMLLSAMADRPIDNLRLYQGDARLLFEVLPEACLGRVFVLYPDPWPKKRHVGRRFIGPENLDWLSRLMKPGAMLRLASDIPAYIEHSRDAVLAHAGFRIIADTREPWADWVSTRYEAKALREGRTPRYVTIERR
jgi:tRNA (guanine-N7-)-methyltransferase